MTSSETQAPASTPRVIRAYEFAQFEQKAEDCTPADIVAAARMEADEIRRRAHEAGYEAGRAAIADEAAAALATVRAAADAFTAAEREALQTLEHQAAEVAIAIAEQIVSAHVELDPQVVVEVARGALRRVADRRRVTLLVNPDDLGTLVRAGASLQEALGGIEQLDIQADRRVGPGGVNLRTDAGEIDASLATQMQTARTMLLGAMREPEGVDDAG